MSGDTKLSRKRPMADTSIVRDPPKADNGLVDGSPASPLVDRFGDTMAIWKRPHNAAARSPSKSCPDPLRSPIESVESP